MELYSRDSGNNNSFPSEKSVIRLIFEPGATQNQIYSLIKMKLSSGCD